MIYLMVNVGKYTIHGSYGFGLMFQFFHIRDTPLSHLEGLGWKA